MWQASRARSLGVRARRQAPFGPYILDFAVPSVALAIEIDVDTWLNAQGWTVLRYTNAEVLTNLAVVLQDLQAPLEKPSPACGRGSGEGPTHQSAPENQK